MWGNDTGFPNLVGLSLNDNQLNGTLPTSWGSLGFQNLTTLSLDSNSALTGEFVPN